MIKSREFKTDRGFLHLTKVRCSLAGIRGVKAVLVTKNKIKK